MAKYRVKEKSFIGNIVVEAGAIIEHDGAPGDNLEPVPDKPAAKKGQKAAYDTDPLE